MIKKLYSILLFMDLDYEKIGTLFLSHMFITWSFSNNTAVQISINRNKYYLFFEYIEYCCCLGIWYF